MATWVFETFTMLAWPWDKRLEHDTHSVTNQLE